LGWPVGWLVVGLVGWLVDWSGVEIWETPLKLSTRRTPDSTWSSETMEPKISSPMAMTGMIEKMVRKANAAAMRGSWDS
jgi:hypothetical protein